MKPILFPPHRALVAFLVSAILALMFTAVPLPQALAQENTSGQDPVQQTPGTSAEDTQQKLLDVRKEIEQNHTKIIEVQQKAVAQPSVQEAQNEYKEALNAAMIEEKPAAKSLIDKSEALRNELLKDPQIEQKASQDDPEVKSKLEEYRELDQQIAPIREQAAQKPACQEKFRVLQTVMLAEMEKIDPAVPGLMQRNQQLLEQYRELEQRQQGG